MTTHARYDTAEVAPRDRFAFWREAVCDSYVQLGCDAENTTDFQGSIEISRHSALSVSRVSGSVHTVSRRKRDIGSAVDEYFLLSLQMSATSRISQFGSTAHLKPGDMALYVTSEPYRLDLVDGFSHLVVQVPKQRLLERLPNAQGLAGKRIDGQTGIGKLVRENIIAFTQHADGENPALQSLVQTTLIDLVATGIASNLETEADLSSPEQHILLRAKSFIGANLSDPDLDRTSVAAEVGLSVRRLNTIFAKENLSLSSYIRESRLAAVAKKLQDPRYDALSVSELAIANGFSNLQHFSTLFRSKFDRSPRAYRLQARSHSKS